MSKAEILSKLVAVNGVLSDNEISLADITNLATVATSGSYTDLSDKPTTDTLPEGTIAKYASPIKQFALINIIRG